jgi:hypothetical protein
MGKVFREIAHENYWRFKTLAGMQTTIPQDRDVVLYAHSLIDFHHMDRPWVGVHVIRDPRDIIVSGYLYHLRTGEEWCTNSNFDLQRPILSPRVPYTEEHKAEEWKENYIKSLGGISYQENLLKRSQSDGLYFEMDNMAGWAIENMAEWDYNMKNVLEVKFEDLMADYDHVFQSIFEFIGLKPEQADLGLKIAEKHDIGRKTDDEIKKIEHVSSKKTNRWMDFFEEGHKAYFKEKFGSILVDLGYESDDAW